MATLKTNFEIPASTRTWSIALMAAGAVAILLGLITKGLSSDPHKLAVFWGVLLYNSVFFLLIANAAMFFICATTLAMGGWQITFRRVSEAISTLVPVFGTIAGVLMIFLVLTHKSYIYFWSDKSLSAGDHEIVGKSGFLNPTFFVTWTVLTIGLWSLLGARMRRLSAATDEPMDATAGARWIWNNTVTAAMFIVWFALTVGSVTPWFWLMSLDADWYSTMYSWYNFASSFVAGMALIGIWVIYLKNKGYLELTNNEHLQDIGKFMFAFSIFWTYLWFAQYMLIWYANIPEETVYFKHRVQGAYKGIFFLNLILNFVGPFLILMTRRSKRSYTLMTFMCVWIIFGHWLDYFQMVMGSVSKGEVSLSWYDFGVAAFFVGLMIWCVTRALASRPLIARYHPFLKESVIHHV